MSLSFPKLGPCFIWWGGPWSARDADGGVRPTSYLMPVPGCEKTK